MSKKKWMPILWRQIIDWLIDWSAGRPVLERSKKRYEIEGKRALDGEGKIKCKRIMKSARNVGKRSRKKLDSLDLFAMDDGRTRFVKRQDMHKRNRSRNTSRRPPLRPMSNEIVLQTPNLPACKQEREREGEQIKRKQNFRTLKHFWFWKIFHSCRPNVGQKSLLPKVCWGQLKLAQFRPSINRLGNEIVLMKKFEFKIKTQSKVVTDEEIGFALTEKAKKSSERGKCQWKRSRVSKREQDSATVKLF